MQLINTPRANSPSAIYWMGVVLVPVLFILTMRFVDQPAAIETSWLRSNAWSVNSDSDQPPEFSDDTAEAVLLPDSTPVDRAGIASVWYQFRIPPTAATNSLWAVYLPYTYGNFAVYVNGDLVGLSSPMVTPYAYFRTPLYFEFPASLLKAEVNSVAVRLVSVRYLAWMDAVYIGPSVDLKPTYDHANFVQVSLMRATIVALCLVTILALGLVWVRPTDTAYGWFAAANLCWAVYNYLLIEPRIPFPVPDLWFTFPVIAIGWFSICSAHFINRLPGCGGPQVRMERIFLAFGVLGAGAIVLQRMLSHEPSWIQLYFWLPGAILINAYIVQRLLRAIRRNSTFEVKLWLMAAVLTLSVGIHDYLGDENLVAQGSVHYLSYTVSLVLVVFGLTLFSRLTRALTEAEMLNRELETRVEAKRIELARNYERLQGLEQERAIGAERIRMTTDMHDGIGGQLMHALAVIEDNPIFQPLEPILRNALDDLRLIIDSADPMEGNLLVVLSNFRARNERRVKEGGLRFLWEVTDLPSLQDFGPHKVLQVLRVLQEALTNVLKHAHATEVVVRTGSKLDANGRATIVVDIADDGCGYVIGDSSGRGINNMRRRVDELGGSIEFSTAVTGSRVRVILPVDAQSRVNTL